MITRRFGAAVNVKGLRVDKGVDEILTQAGASWEIIVGPGFKEGFLPGYPANPETPLLESDYAGKKMLEISFSKELRIGQFKAHDYFGDGSFYLLDVPGHAVGHMCDLVRTTENSFIFLGADACHFAGALRPSQYLPWPEMLDRRWGLDSYFSNLCPCQVFGECHLGKGVEKRSSPYYMASKAPGSAYVDPERANESIQGWKEFDASGDVLVCLAHDPGLFEVLPLLNDGIQNDINGWKEKGHKEMLRWRFLNELPRDGKPGRELIVLGFWRDGKEVDPAEALAK